MRRSRSVGTDRRLRVGVIGLGVIGQSVVQSLKVGIDGLQLVAVSGRDPIKTREAAERLGNDVAACSLDELVALADIVFDCATAASLPEIAACALAAGRVLLTMNSGALLANPHLFELAAANGAQIIVPSGGVVGFDGLRAAALGELHSVTLVSRKPPASLADAPHILDQGLDLSNLKKPLLVFAGNAAEAARLFPANANVAATLSLAGVGPMKTAVEIWADPTVTRISQFVHVLSDAAELQLQIYSNAMPGNPRTGSLTPLSAIAALRSIVAPLRIGS
ncbi:aspartate dehydrogenase [soil metagenome]